MFLQSQNLIAGENIPKNKDKIQKSTKLTKCLKYYVQSYGVTE